MTIKLNGKKVMIISPHLDDEVIGCGGLIEACKRKGAILFILYCCSGNNRQITNDKIDAETTDSVRLAELNELSKKADYKWKLLFQGDEYFIRLDSMAQKDLLDPIEDEIFGFKPDLLLIPFKDSYNQDHRAVFTACMTALRPIPQKLRYFVPMVMMYGEPYTWTINEIFRPNIYLDISEFMKMKVELMNNYATQVRDDPFSRSNNNLMREAHIRGAEVGVAAAEGYMLLRGIF